MFEDYFTVVGLQGVSPLELSRETRTPLFVMDARENSELAALNGYYVADPFVYLANGLQYLFVELLLKNGKGVIARAERVDESGTWGNFRIVLEEPFHLSYPLIFEVGGEVFMTVESAEADEVRIYRARNDQLDSWSYERGLVQGKHYDPTIFKHEDTWFMFSCVDPSFSITNLYLSKEGILGPWVLHPKSPVVADDASAARSAGPLLQWNAKKYRLAQDCSERYGAAVKAFEITQLTADQYSEKEYGTILSSGNENWNTHGMHHLQVYRVDESKVFAVSDGYTKLNKVEI